MRPLLMRPHCRPKRIIGKWNLMKKSIESCFIKKHIDREFVSTALPGHLQGTKGHCVCGRLPLQDWTLEMRFEVWLHYQATICIGGLQAIADRPGRFGVWIPETKTKTSRCTCATLLVLSSAPSNSRPNIELMKLTYLIKMSSCPSNYYGLWR